LRHSSAELSNLRAVNHASLLAENAAQCKPGKQPERRLPFIRSIFPCRTGLNGSGGNDARAGRIPLTLNPQPSAFNHFGAPLGLAMKESLRRRRNLQK